MDIFNEISWPQFKKLNNIRHLSLNEQVDQYNQYLYTLSIHRSNWLALQNKGPLYQESTSIEENFLLQENNDFLLQENGFNLIIE